MDILIFSLSIYTLPTPKILLPGHKKPKKATESTSRPTEISVSRLENSVRRLENSVAPTVFALFRLRNGKNTTPEPHGLLCRNEADLLLQVGLVNSLHKDNTLSASKQAFAACSLWAMKAALAVKAPGNVKRLKVKRTFLATQNAGNYASRASKSISSSDSPASFDCMSSCLSLLASHVISSHSVKLMPSTLVRSTEASMGVPSSVKVVS